MALKVKDLPTGQQVEITSILPTLTPLGSDWAIYPYVAGNYDPILGFLTQCYHVRQVVSPATAVRYKQYGHTTQDFDLLGYRPSSRPYDFVQDSRLFGSLLNGLRTARSDRRKIAAQIEASGEHNVQHIHCIGSAREKPATVSLSDFAIVWGGSYWGVGVPSLLEADGYQYLRTTNNIGIYSEPEEAWSDTFSAKCSTWEMLQLLVDYEAGSGPIHRVSNLNGRRRESWCSDISTAITPQGVINVDYKLRHRLWTTTLNDNRWNERTSYVSIRIYYHFHHDTHFDWAEDVLLPLNGFNVSLAITVYNPSEEHIVGPYWPAGTPPSSTWSQSWGVHNYSYSFSNNWVVSNVKSSFSLNPVMFQSTTKATLATVLQTWKKEVETDNLEYIRAMFYSSADALSTFSQIIRENHIETISELLQGSSLLPSLVPFAQLYRSVRALRLLDAGVALIDVGTSLRLWDRYGGGSNLRAFEEFSSSFERVRSRLANHNVWGPRTLNGKFSFAVPNTSRIMVARSKLRVRFDSSVILSLVLSGGAVGLVPTLSALWDLIPFSFVADWFLNIGTRVEDIEARSFMLMLPVTYVTHSITVLEEMSEKQLALLNLEPITDSGQDEYPTLKYYMRVVSSMLPPIREGRYDFRASYGPTDMVTAGSLAWSLMRRA